jgi:HAD superfamily hydrolase (TIGR01493 family)
MWNKNKILSKPFPDTVENLERLHKDYTLVLVANIDNLNKDVIEKFSLQKYFDHIFLSCDTGMLKTDEKFYDVVMKETGLNKEDVLIVGDSIESDMKAAEAAGIAHVLIDRNNRMDYDNKITSLNDLE